MSANLVSVDFEIHGKVQGVHFRKYTQEQSKLLGLKGWCMNTTRGTVVGNVQGSSDKINQMKSWLKNKGSPKSRIDKADFLNEKVITEFSCDEFVIRK